MEVLWMADFGLQHNIGGAQRTNDFVINEGISRGYEITSFNSDSPDKLLNDDYDLVVTNNFESLCRRKNVLEYAISHKNHVRYEHDSNSYLAAGTRKDFFKSAQKTIFLSEYHHEEFKRLYGDIFHDVHIVSPFINTSEFCDRGEERQDKTLYVGFFHWLKGTNKFLEQVVMNPDKDFAVAGWGPTEFTRAMGSLRNLEVLGRKEHEDMPDLFNRYKRLYFHPVGFEAFCRSIGEAAFCGIEIDCGDNIGGWHEIDRYGIDKVKEMCTNSPKRFWEIVE